MSRGSNYLLPSIVSVPVGYDTIIRVPYEQIGGSLGKKDAIVINRYRLYHEGELQREHEERLQYQAGRLVGERPDAFHIQDPGASWGDRPGFLECEQRTEDGSLAFVGGRSIIVFYAIHAKAGRKSFISDNVYKFANPNTIDQIAAFGTFAETYPAVVIDRDRDYSEAIGLCNPYNLPVLCTVLAEGDRALPRIKVPPRSVRLVRLNPILSDSESSWRGTIQIRATNRLICFNIKYAGADPSYIVHHDHLDAFRGEKTRIPLTRWLRVRFGWFLVRHTGRRESKSL